MKFLGNIIWLIFGGLHTAIEYFIAGLVLMITIIGIPFGLQRMKLGMLAIWPLGSKVKWKESQPAALHHHHRHPLGKDALSAGKAGSVTIRNGSRISHSRVECLSDELFPNNPSILSTNYTLRKMANRLIDHFLGGAQTDLNRRHSEPQAIYQNLR